MDMAPGWLSKMVQHISFSGLNPIYVGNLRMIEEKQLSCIVNNEHVSPPALFQRV